MRSIDEEEYGGATTAAGAMTQVVNVILTRYRWILTLRSFPDAPPGDKMFLSFSVPTSLLPDQPTAPDVDADEDIKMEKAEQQDQEQKARVTVPAACAVDGCTTKRKHGLPSANAFDLKSLRGIWLAIPYTSEQLVAPVIVGCGFCIQ